MKILFSSNLSWSIYNFRLDLLKALQSEGHEIFVTARRDDYSDLLSKEGMEFHETKINNNSRNPVSDLRLLWSYIKLYKRLKPDVVLHNAIKPNIYGAIAAGILGIPVINNISGLGTLFITSSISTRIAKFLYWISQKFATVVFFQNPFDRQLFIDNGLAKGNKLKLVPGSGVDTTRFINNRIRLEDSNFVFLFIGRLLIDKGIQEFVEAAGQVLESFPETKFKILGPFYDSNSTSISQEQLDIWVESRVIDYLGTSDRVNEEMESCDCVVLPSYREGLSKVLIEASSMSLPIITTDVPGCRDVVVDGETGNLCKVKDSNDLANKMMQMLALSNTDRLEMGAAARRRAIDVFDVKHVIEIYKREISNIRKVEDV